MRRERATIQRRGQSERVEEREGNGHGGVSRGDGELWVRGSGGPTLSKSR